MKEKRLNARDIQFFFGGGNGAITGPEPQWWTCGICGKKFNDHGLDVVLEGVSLDRGAWVGDICGECLTSVPKRLAERIREWAPILRGKRPRRGDDEDTNTNWADGLLRVATLFDTLDSLDAITGGALAREIGEGYKDMEALRPQRPRKAA